MQETYLDNLYTALFETLEKVQERIKKEVTPFGLNYNEYEILKYIYYNGDQPIQKIGDNSKVTSGSMTYLVDKLEKKNYIFRKPCLSDRRVMYGSLTEAGEELMKQVLPKCTKAISSALEDCSEEEIFSAIQILEKIR